jgi:hypothetical protein
MARRVKRPKASGESKTGLVIALVFFVLVSIGLGVATYFGFSEQEKLRTDKKAAEKKADTEKNHASAYKLESKILRLRSGDAKLDKKSDQDKTDVEEYNYLRGEYDGKKIPPETHKDLRDEIDTLLTKYNWKDRAKDPTKDENLLQQIARLEKEREVAKNRADKEQERATNLEAKVKDTQRDADEKVKAAQRASDLAQQKAKESKDENKKQVETLEGKFKGYLEEIEAAKRATEDAKNETKKRDEEIAKLKADLKAEIERRKILDAKYVKVNPLDYQEPWGKIIRLERAGGMAYINLGSADKVKPQLTFSIATKGLDGKAAPGQRKGSLEVVRVVDRNLSLAKITNVRDPFNDPIMTGDLLFNPAWSPNQHQHVAIAGIIDLHGDGTDSTPEFIRNLEREGIIVDAYLDLRDGTIKPKGIEGLTPDTRYLIIGEKPGFGSGGTVIRDDPRTKRKEEVLAKMSEMVEKAKDQGTSLIGYRDFVLLVGYPMPRGSTVTSESPGSAPEPTLPQERKGGDKEPGKEPEKQPGKEPAKEPGKEVPKEEKPPKEDKPPKEQKDK